MTTPPHLPDDARPSSFTVDANRPGFVRVRGAREHNLKDVDVDITRDARWGGISAANAIGSARSVTEPSAPCTLNL